MKKDLKSTVDYFFEVGMLAGTPRSYHPFLGNGRQSVAEHVHRVVHIGYVLAGMEEKKVDTEKVLKMCLFHDVIETRISDLNYVNQKYVKTDDEKALKDLAAPLPFGKDIVETVEEYENRESRESIIAKEADILEFILSLKEQMDVGNARVASWLPHACGRLKTENGKALAEQILETASDDWWHVGTDDEWWISRNKNK
ncbi:MAG: phosphohydrolase [Patescibacteria group bacterium]|jgi:putative hydrolase of HD superfamily|nr:phosphohydrolase [Patescibacteria group bacterium]